MLNNLKDFYTEKFYDWDPLKNKSTTKVVKEDICPYCFGLGVVPVSWEVSVNEK